MKTRSRFFKKKANKVFHKILISFSSILLVIPTENERNLIDHFLITLQGASYFKLSSIHLVSLTRLINSIYHHKTWRLKSWPFTTNKAPKILLKLTLNYQETNPIVAYTQENAKWPLTFNTFAIDFSFKSHYFPNTFNISVASFLLMCICSASSRSLSNISLCNKSLFLST